nr:MAG TPA: hypothetical protein [Caudoviricetes sp.]
MFLFFKFYLISFGLGGCNGHPSSFEETTCKNIS